MREDARAFYVSIHAPAGGATGGREERGAREWFQSTRPQGARRYSSSSCQFPRCFNPRARRGRDRHGRGLLQRERVSIHADRGGATRTSPRKWSKTCSFNPRARRGRDQLRPAFLHPLVVSIHAPAGGATMRGFAMTVGFARFQSTRPQGARLDATNDFIAVSLVSIHAPAGGATRGGHAERGPPDVSIHAPAGGATAWFG